MTFFDIPKAEGPQPELPPPSPEDETKMPGWDEWEDDEDDGTITPIEDDEQLLAGEIAPPATTHTPRKSSTKTNLATRHSVYRPKRLKSRGRQKAQNAKAGIRLITDMAGLHRPAHQSRKSPGVPRPRFVDLAALRALEGSPTSATVGNWNWLRRKKSAASAPHLAPQVIPEQDLSPADGPIVIGISMDTEALQAREISPNTAVIQSAVEFPPITIAGPARPTVETASPDTVSPLTPSHLKSVWSPDTPSTAATLSPRAASSLYSQITGASAETSRFGPSVAVPPVPEVPANYRRNPQNLISIASADDLDAGTPCTLFEEDGTLSPSAARRFQQTSLSPGGVASGAMRGHADYRRSRGWWDEHLASPTPTVAAPGPFTQTQVVSQEATLSPVPQIAPLRPVSPFYESSRSAEESTSTPQEEKKSADEWWRGMDAKKQPVVAEAQRCPTPQSVHVLRLGPTPIIRTPSPRRTPSPNAIPSRSGSPRLPLGSATMASSSQSPLRRGETMAGKAAVLAQENSTPTEEPPPYSPPHTSGQAPVRYRALFPPDHPLHTRFPPSPGPVSPGVTRAMTSQGAVNMTEIPLTPAGHATSFNDRPAGTFIPQEHSLPADGPQYRVERDRRRYEKEEVLARKAGGLWRGRWCIPASGCYGRAGREGRKRRRICLGVAVGVIAMMILGIVLGVVLSKKGAPAPEIESIFVNLTGFPPMPTGVLTVVGPDNSRSFDGCTQPKTLWSCELPKELQDSVSPYNANQPTVAMQIQFDNNPSLSWNVPNGKPPVPTQTPASKPASSARRNAKRFAPGISPEPEPPSFEEMWFLGNTTDGVVSDDKAGEPTPFYISLLSSKDQTVGANMIEKRESGLVDRQLGVELPAPDRKDDGTGATARILPEVRQQPVRLFDRGLPTEHYGFYTYFRRTIYVRSLTTLNQTEAIGDVPLDQNGGSRETEADFLVTWAETRFHMKIWTNSAASKGLLAKGDKPGIEDTVDLTRPGTMPYPVTMTLDTHGGDPQTKFVWAWSIDERQRIDTLKPKFLSNDMSKGGTLVNPRINKNPSFGGFDGGSGGCQCEWLNFVEKR